jgi:hypothetical protein
MRRGWRWAVLPAVGTLSVVLSSCTMLQPPDVDRPDLPATTSPAGPGTAWYLGSSEREAPEGTRAFRFAEAEPTTPVTVDFGVDADEFAEIASWEAEMTNAAPGPRFETSIQLEAVTGAAIRWRLLQVDRCGRIVAASRYTPDQRMEGTYDWDLEIETNWQVGDQLRLSLEARKIADAAVAEAALAIDSPDSVISSTMESLPPPSEVSEPAGPPIDPGPVALSNLLPMSDDVEGTSTAGLPANEFRWNNQRVFWWNETARRWDGILPTGRPPAAGDSHWWLWKDLAGTPTPVQELSARTANTPDAFWDEGCATLDVFFSRDAFGTSRFQRLSYDPDTDTYLETTTPGGVKAPESLRGSKRVTITKTDNGYLWAAVNHEGRLLVSRSIDGGVTWPEPVSIKSTAANGDTHWVEYTDGAGDRLGVVATENGLVGNAKAHFLSLDPASTEWDEPGAWRDETPLLPPPEGDETADDELSAVSFEDWVYFVIETEPGPESRPAALPQLVLYARSPAGVWGVHVVNRFTENVGDDRKRPVITVDASCRQVIIGAGRDNQRTASIFVTPIGDLDSWQEHILFDLPEAGAEALYNVRLPRQPVDSSSQLLVLVEEVGAQGEVWRQVVEIAPAG